MEKERNWHNRARRHRSLGDVLEEANNPSLHVTRFSYGAINT